jgi:hypothetical protein
MTCAGLLHLTHHGFGMVQYEPVKFYGMISIEEVEVYNSLVSYLMAS